MSQSNITSNSTLENGTENIFDRNSSQIQQGMFKLGEIFEKNKLLIILSAVFFCALAYGFWYYIVKPSLSPVNPPEASQNREFVPNTADESRKTATLYYFYTNWCPICSKCNNEVDLAMQNIGASDKNNNVGEVNGVGVILEKVDCDKNTELADSFEITGYPTIKLVYLDTVYEYDAKPSADVIVRFLKTMLEPPGNDALKMASN